MEILKKVNKQKPSYEGRTYNIDYRYWLLRVGLHETRMISWIIDHSEYF